MAGIRGAAVLGFLVLAGGGTFVLSSGDDGYVRSMASFLRPLLGGASTDAGRAGGSVSEPRAAAVPDRGLPLGSVRDPGRDVPIGADPAVVGTVDSKGALPRSVSSEPAGVLVVGGQARTGAAGDPLAGPVVIRVVNEQGNGVAGVDVLFEIASGGGSVQPARSVTGDDGTASVAWTLGDREGAQTLRARVSGTGTAEITTEIIAQAVVGAGPQRMGEANADSIAELTADRTAHAEPGNAAQAAADSIAEAGAELLGDSAEAVAGVPAPVSLEIVQGLGQEAPPGTALSTPLEVRVTDAGGRPLSDVPVRFAVVSGGGRVSPAVSETSTRGIARAGWTLGPRQGPQEVRAFVEGAASLEVEFAAGASEPRLVVRPSVTAGGTHSCFLRSGGSLVCWGSNGSGQLGDGTTSRRVVPGAEVGGGPFASVAVGVAHVCALSTAGRVACWGLNGSGQLGNGTTASRASPAPTAGDRAFVTVSAGASHTCALTAAGAAYCWGGNQHGQLGDGSTQQSTTPVRVESAMKFGQIAAGWRHTCALDGEGAAYCWGSNQSGQVGVASGEATQTPTPVAGGHRFQSLAAGSEHTCGVTAQGRILCWGANGAGQLGDGTGQSRATPVLVFDPGPFTAVVAGGIHSCGLTASGALRCWGGNVYGQLGDGSTMDRSTPVPVQSDVRFVQVHALGSHTCGRNAGGELFCWGYNVDGQLGDGTRENRSVPTRVILGSSP